VWDTQVNAHNPMLDQNGDVDSHGVAWVALVSGHKVVHFHLRLDPLAY
jgi:hypothetical protein